MDCEQMTDRVNQVGEIKELVRESASLLEELKRANQELKCPERDVQTLKNRLTQCIKEIISLANQNDIDSAFVNLVSETPTPILMCWLMMLELDRLELEKSLPTLPPEQGQKTKIDISKYAEQIEIIFCQLAGPEN
jgi:hypothetical protein